MSEILDKKLRYLILVESPEKSKTITKIFRDAGYNNVTVMATIGHFTKLNIGTGYYNTGIYPEDNFKIDYVIDDNKKENIRKLKEQIKFSDFVYLAADPDREGTAIAWSCAEFLNIPKKKYRRIMYQAINKKAIFEAIQNASDIDLDMLNAAHTRQALDALLGFRLSGVVRNKVNCKSVGRVQTAALQLIVDRELEIINFKPEKYFDLYLHFIKNKTEFKAKYQGTDKKPIKRLDTQEQINKIFEDCKGNKFVVKSVDYKDRFEYPKPPFSTATFQQECSNKLGLTVNQSQECAQKLFDAGKISYHRTDSEIFEEEFEGILKDYTSKNYDKKYLSGNIVKGKNDADAQEGHEALHVLDLKLTPDKYEDEAPSELLAKVYRLIYNRTLATAFKPATIAQTTYNIYNNEHKFILNSNELKFEGYRYVYSYKDESEQKEQLVKETFKEGEELKECSFESIPMETKPKSRFKEASFVKEMKDVGIGRPSTYASTIETIKSDSRGYCKVVDKCLKPTDKGMTLIEFVKNNLSDLINIGYTRDMEKSLDLIAQGKLNYLEFLKSFFEKLTTTAEKIDSDKTKYKKKSDVIEESTENIVCPNCGSKMNLRKGKYGPFYGCSKYPDCKTIINLKSIKKK